MDLKTWCGAAVGITALLNCATAFAVDNDTYQSTNRPAGARPSTAINVDDSWWPFGRAERRAAKGTALAGRPNASDPAVETSNLRGMTPKELAAQVNQARDAYVRRLNICDRIKQIAEETGDSALESQAELLQQRAMMLFQQRVNHLRLPGVLPESESEAAAVLTAEKKPLDRPARADASPIRSVRGNQSSSVDKE